MAALDNLLIDQLQHCVCHARLSLLGGQLDEVARYLTDIDDTLTNAIVERLKELLEEKYELVALHERAINHTERSA